MQTIAIFVCKKISSNSFKTKIKTKPTNYGFTNHIYIYNYSTVFKHMTDIKLSVLHSNT